MSFNTHRDHYRDVERTKLPLSGSFCQGGRTGASVSHMNMRKIINAPEVTMKVQHVHRATQHSQDTPGTVTKQAFMGFLLCVGHSCAQDLPASETDSGGDCLVGGYLRG